VLVVDATALVELLLDRPAGRQIAGLITGRASDLHAPHLLDVEVLSALRALALRDEVDERRADEALHDFGNLPIERYPHHGFLGRAWELRATFSAYDAVYVALTEALAPDGATLLTADGRLALAATPFVSVKLVGGA
jgi:predicted nucleic acid-binding protein